jgi:hypothetical protein
MPARATPATGDERQDSPKDLPGHRDLGHLERQIAMWLTTSVQISMRLISDQLRGRSAAIAMFFGLSPISVVNSSFGRVKFFVRGQNSIVLPRREFQT